MNINEIRKLPTDIPRKMAEDFLGGNATAMHESLLQSYHILNKVKDYLKLKCPPEIVLEMIYECQNFYEGDDESKSDDESTD